MAKRTIVVIEDDQDIAASIQYNLRREGDFVVHVAHTGEDGLLLVAKERPALLILDLNLPSMTGFEVCRRLRNSEATATIPIIMLTARTAEGDKVLGLDLGADDYITKPFSVRELMARVNAILRRVAAEKAQPVYDDGYLQIDFENFTVRVGRQEVKLTRKEFDLLATLARRPGRVLTRDYLFDTIWGVNHYGETRTLNVHIQRLRLKLGEARDYIDTVIGVGYRFVKPPRDQGEVGPQPGAESLAPVGDARN
jgi:DNA-binding response OmpR family regulator